MHDNSGVKMINRCRAESGDLDADDSRFMAMTHNPPWNLTA